jgi:hypothetical protein
MTFIYLPDSCYKPLRHTYTILPLSFLFLFGYVTVYTSVRDLSCATVPGRAWLLLMWNLGT